MVSTIRYFGGLSDIATAHPQISHPKKTMTFHSERNFPEALSRRATGQEFLEICCPEVLERSLLRSSVGGPTGGPSVNRSWAKRSYFDRWKLVGGCFSEDDTQISKICCFQYLRLAMTKAGHASIGDLLTKRWMLGADIRLTIETLATIVENPSRGNHVH